MRHRPSCPSPRRTSHASLVGLSLKMPPIRLNRPRSRFITWLSSWSSTGSIAYGLGSVTMTDLASSLICTAPAPIVVEVHHGVDRADTEELHPFACDGAGHVLDVLLEVEGHLELSLRGMEIGKIAQFSENRRGEWSFVTVVNGESSS